ncbi:c-type cytochrome [Shewanella woodyi]|uniref:c-type cytochrome n=1 Tax=Shewanella woodyi TaxID=60961 RepID=UPI000A77F002|nr:c-type cytochrome [Shewanella woodyi]
MGVNKNKKSKAIKAISLSIGLAVMGSMSAASAADDQALLNMCKACHGNDGSSEFASIPNLKWQNTAYMVKQLEQFKSGQRQDKTMTKVAKILNKQQMEALASYFNKGKEE